MKINAQLHTLAVYFWGKEPSIPIGRKRMGEHLSQSGEAKRIVIVIRI
jgi:hypothetical protein